MPLTYTPLRFPGGKSKIYPFVSALLETNELVGCTYAEGFCEGAGLAIFQSTFPAWETTFKKHTSSPICLDERNRGQIVSGSTNICFT